MKAPLIRWEKKVLKKEANSELFITIINKFRIESG